MDEAPLGHERRPVSGDHPLAAGTKCELLLVTDGWLANTGDAAIQLAMRRSLRKVFPGARLPLACHQRALVGHCYRALDLVPPLDVLAGVRSPWTEPGDVSDVARHEIEELVSSATAVIVPGGGFLVEEYGPDSRLAVYEELLRRDKRLVFYAQSIGRFRPGPLRNRLARILNEAEIVILRDAASKDNVLELGVCSSRVRLTADEGFLFSRRPLLCRRPTADALLVCASAHPWAGSGWQPPGETGLDELRDLLCYAVDRYGTRRITLLSTVQGLGGAAHQLEDDALFSQLVYERLPDRVRKVTQRIARYVTPREFVAYARAHTLILSMRMHGAILAATSGVPSILANASSKATWLTSRPGFALAGLKSGETLEHLAAHVDTALSDPRRHASTQARFVASERRQAGLNAQLVRDSLA